EGVSSRNMSAGQDSAKNDSNSSDRASAKQHASPLDHCLRISLFTVVRRVVMVASTPFQDVTLFCHSSKESTNPPLLRRPQNSLSALNVAVTLSILLPIYAIVIVLKIANGFLVARLGLDCSFCALCAFVVKAVACKGRRGGYAGGGRRGQ